MTYQTADTQPERTALAWTRTSLALFAASIWVCRAAFLGESVFAATVLAVSVGLVTVNYFLIRTRKRKLRRGVDDSTATGIANLLVVAQVALLAMAALLIDPHAI